MPHFSLYLTYGPFCVQWTGEAGGFFLACEDLGQRSAIHSPPAHFFFKVEISSRTLIPLFRPGSLRSGSAS